MVRLLHHCLVFMILVLVSAWNLPLIHHPQLQLQLHLVHILILVQKKQSLLHVLELTLDMKGVVLFPGAVLVGLLKYKGTVNGTLLLQLLHLPAIQECLGNLYSCHRMTTDLLTQKLQLHYYLL